MILSSLTLAAVSLAPLADYVHHTRIDHRGAQVGVSYRADTKFDAPDRHLAWHQGEHGTVYVDRSGQRREGLEPR